MATGAWESPVTRAVATPCPLLQIGHGPLDCTRLRHPSAPCRRARHPRGYGRRLGRDRVSRGACAPAGRGGRRRAHHRPHGAPHPPRHRDGARRPDARRARRGSGGRARLRAGPASCLRCRARRDARPLALGARRVRRARLCGENGGAAHGIDPAQSRAGRAGRGYVATRLGQGDGGITPGIDRLDAGAILDAMGYG